MRPGSQKYWLLTELNEKYHVYTPIMQLRNNSITAPSAHAGFRSVERAHLNFWEQAAQHFERTFDCELAHTAPATSRKGGNGHLPAGGQDAAAVRWRSQSSASGRSVGRVRPCGLRDSSSS